MIRTRPARLSFPVVSLLVPAALAVLLLAGEGGSPPPAAADPVVVVTHQGGMRPGAKSGLVLAVWEDGTLLLAADPSSPGERLLAGKAEKADVGGLLEAIGKAGFLEERREGFVVPDAASTSIGVRSSGKRALHSWHEMLLPGFGGDLNTDADYRRFVRMWKGTRGPIEALAPVEVRRLEEAAPGGKFRGYDPASPARTSWMRPEAWRG